MIFQHLHFLNVLKLLITKPLNVFAYMFSGLTVNVFVLKDKKSSQEVFPNEPPVLAKRLAHKESWIEQGEYLPFNVSYQLLAGHPSIQQSE